MTFESDTNIGKYLGLEDQLVETPVSVRLGFETQLRPLPVYFPYLFLFNVLLRFVNVIFLIDSILQWGI